MIHCLGHHPSIHCIAERRFQMKHLKRQWISAKNLTQSLPAALSDPILRAAPITSLLCQMKIKLWFQLLSKAKCTLLPSSFKLSESWLNNETHPLNCSPFDAYTGQQNACDSGRIKSCLVLLTLRKVLTWRKYLCRQGTAYLEKRCLQAVGSCFFLLLLFILQEKNTLNKDRG